MLKISLAVAVTAASLASAAPAQTARLTPAQETAYATALGECMGAQTSGEDRVMLAQWFVTVLNSSPKIKDVATVAPGKKDELDRKVAALFTRLMTVDCSEQARPLWRARSMAGFRVAGEVLGRLAMQEVMSGGDGDRMFSGYASYINPGDFVGLEQ